MKAIVVLVGDSFVEANMLPVHEGLAAQIESRLENKLVFAMGGPGSSLLDYAERIQFARKNFGSKLFIIVINIVSIDDKLGTTSIFHGLSFSSRMRTSLAFIVTNENIVN